MMMTRLDKNKHKYNITFSVMKCSMTILWSDSQLSHAKIGSQYNVKNDVKVTSFQDIKIVFGSSSLNSSVYASYSLWSSYTLYITLFKTLDTL